MQPDLTPLLRGIAPEIAAQARPLGLELPSNLSRDDWSTTITRLAANAHGVTKGHDTVCAWLGDMLAYRDGKYHGQIAELAKAAELHPTTLRNAKLVCQRIPISCRRDTLSWSHHSEIGKTFPNGTDITNWLQIADDEKLSCRDLRKRIRASRVHQHEEVQSGGLPLDLPDFCILRELRAAERSLQQHHAIWQRWSPETCRAALQEIKHLSEFVSQLAARAEKPAA